MNDLVRPIPLPESNVTIRPATLADVDFLDALQKKTTQQVGFMPRKQFEGKVAAGHVLIAEEVESSELRVERKSEDASPLSTLNCQLSTPRRVGYLIGNDQYFKHDDVGIIYQINVVPERRRSLVAASLLKAQFARSAYGCKLYCCWCAQDIEANRFWQSMGFVPLAYRAGSEKKARVHIFWQKRIRAGDESTPWWFPSLTSGGSIREDRIVLPIPPGTDWREAKPLILPGVNDVPALPAPKRTRAKKVEPEVVAPVAPAPRAVPTMGMGRLSFFEAPAPAVVAPVAVEKPKREKQPKAKHDPKLVAAARELRDRYLEHYNASPIRASGAKYEVGRSIEATPTPAAIALLPAA